MDPIGFLFLLFIIYHVLRSFGLLGKECNHEQKKSKKKQKSEQNGSDSEKKSDRTQTIISLPPTLSIEESLRRFFRKLSGQDRIDYVTVLLKTIVGQLEVLTHHAVAPSAPPELSPLKTAGMPYFKKPSLNQCSSCLVPCRTIDERIWLNIPSNDESKIMSYAVCFCKPTCAISYLERLKDEMTKTSPVETSSTTTSHDTTTTYYDY